MAGESKKTRRVFAIILVKNEKEKRLLLSDRADGKGWNLPGGGVEEGEADFDALVREVREETGLEIEPIEQVGEPLLFQGDTAVAYSATIIGGQLIPTKEARQHRYCSAQELRQGYFVIQAKDKKTSDATKIPLTLVGPTGRLGRTGRMVWDGLSLLEEPFSCPSTSLLGGVTGISVSDNGLYLVDDAGLGTLKIWPRADPHSPVGWMTKRWEQK